MQALELVGRVGRVERPATEFMVGTNEVNRDKREDRCRPLRARLLGFCTEKSCVDLLEGGNKEEVGNHETMPVCF